MTERWKWPTAKKIKEAAEELKAIVRASYPEARFQLVRAPDDQHIWLLLTEVDLDDLEQVRELTQDREAEMLIEDNILLYVSPRRGLNHMYESAPQVVRKTG